MKISYLFGALVSIIVMSGCEDTDKQHTDSTAKEKVASISSTVIDAKVVSDMPNITGADWSPKEITLGTSFNKQPNGESALGFKLIGEAKPGTKIELWFDNAKLSDFVLNEKMIIASTIPNLLLSHVGEYPIYLIDTVTKKRFDIGVFSVKPVPSAEVKPAPLAVTSPEINTTTKKSSKPKNTKSQ